MAVTFYPSSDVVKLAMDKMKEDGLVHPEAVFNESAPGGLRREVTARDPYFSYRLGRTKLEEQVVDGALEMMKRSGLVPPSADYDRSAVERHRALLKEKFEGSWTTLSPTMERLMFMLTSVKQPAHLLELGCFWGYTLGWFAGPCVGPAPAFEPERIIGIDVDAGMIEKARANFGGIEGGERVELVAEDARTALDRIDGPFDFVYIEAKFENRQIAAAEAEGFSDPLGPVPYLYLVLLKQVYDRLPPGAWVMAHDNLDWSAKKQMAPYLEFVRDKAHFSESICFDIDDCGMELSIR
ncbi:MAG TPA: class I SAM-dependent methyltransferase [bacterium]|nr:class I SAM-dependent methyltransferase [bacterium]